MRLLSFLAAVVLAIICLVFIAPMPSVAQTNSGSATELLAEPKEVPQVSVTSIEPGLEEANRQLHHRFKRFLRRRDLGFDASLLTLLREDLNHVHSQITRHLTDPSRADPWQAITFFVPIVIILVFAVLYLLLERQFVRWTIRLQGRIHFDFSSWLTTALRPLVITLGRILSILTLVILSIFPLRALAGEPPWALFITQGLLLFLAYRGLKTLVLGLLRLTIKDAEDQHHKKRVERFIGALLRTSLFFLLLLSLTKIYSYHPQAQAFISFAFRLSLALLPLALFFIGDSVLHLLPNAEKGAVYRSLRTILGRNYRGLVAVTIALLLFNAAGYVEAATFLLTRGYALLILGTIWLLGLGRLKAYVERRQLEAHETNSEPSPLLPALYAWISRLGTVALIALAIQFVGLLEPIITILRVPFLAIGSVEISLYNLLTVALIIAVSVLTIRLIKALLNAKLYPALGVEIGSAYAINSLLGYALVTITVILSLSALGVRLSALIVLFASLGVGIGFGLQNITENLVSGFILLFGRAVRKGDFITVNDVYGRVETVGARSVVLRTNDNFSMLVPSKEIVSGRIINWSFHDFLVRLHIPIGLDYGCDPATVRELLLQVAATHSDILPEPKPEVWLTEFGEYSINFELLVYYDCRITSANALKGTFNFLLWEALQQAKLSIPYPQQDLHLRSVDDSLHIPVSFDRQEHSNGAGSPDPPAPNHDSEGRASR